MCGRFTLTSPLELIESLFEAETGAVAEGWKPLYNVAPTDPAPVVVASARASSGRPRAARTVRWGIPNPKGPRTLINARSETARTSPLFGAAFESSRCLVPADGFFEWESAGAARRARYFQQKRGAPFALAGLLVDLPGAPEPGFVILTLPASPSVATVHDRMPALVPAEAYASWVAPSEPREAARLLERSRETAWISRVVGPAVNDARRKGRECLDPPGPPDASVPDVQGRLF